jgi:AraC-like DNA-binding protein
LGARTSEHPDREVWQRFPVRRIEDLRNAVLGADLEAMRMAGPALGGSLAFCAGGGIVLSSGLIQGKVAIRGVPADDAVTLFAGLLLPAGSRLWLEEARDGDIAVIAPGEEIDTVLPDRCLYRAATLSPERLDVEAGWGASSLQHGCLRSTGRHSAVLPSQTLLRLRRQVLKLHTDPSNPGTPERTAEILRQLAGSGFRCRAAPDASPPGRVRIVRRAREYIHEHIAAPMRLADLAATTQTSPRTLHRAFAEVLGDTPQGYVRRLRLHRLRHDLFSKGEGPRTIDAAADRWAAGRDHGRLSARYRALFGENPRATLAWRDARENEIAWL